MNERRNQPQHSPCANPELIADGPNHGWSWYITNVKEGITKLAAFCLYVIHDIFSRYVVALMVAPRERAVLTKRVIEQSFGKQRIAQDPLIIHSDRGPSMTSKSVVLFLADLGITKSLSRPHVSNGNPSSESQFKTLNTGRSFQNGSKGECQNLWYGLSLICLDQQTGASQKRSVGTQIFCRRCFIFINKIQ